MATNKRTQASASSQPPRADARRNRERLLEAAREALGECGVDVGMADVAERAGLGIGTVYRNFSTKEALIDALLLDQLTQVAEASRAAIADEDEPWAALERFIRIVTQRMIEDRSLSQFIGGRIPGSAEVREERKVLFETFSVLVGEAQQAGQLREDIEANDIRVAMICFARATGGDWPDADWVLERYLSLFLDGLRAPGRTALGGTAPATEDLGLAEKPDGTPSALRPGRRHWDP